MSIVNMMSTGTSGIAAEGQALSVAGDNIANVNTVGFKSQRAIFGDMLGRSSGAGSGAGAGVRVTTVQSLFTQGALSSTGVASDLAIEGEGFFVVKGVAGGVDGQYYSRAGQFRFDKEGYFTTPSGLKAQGYATLGDGKFDTTMTPLKLPSLTVAPTATSKIALVGNLDSSAPVIAGGFSAARPGETSNFSTTVTVYDSVGKAHALNAYFTKTADATAAQDATWTYNITSTEAGLSGASLGTGTISYAADGKLASHTPAALTINFQGAQPQTIGINLGTVGALDGMSSFAIGSAINTQTQDGARVGELQGVEVDAQGTMRGIYSNGQKLDVGMMALAKFASNDGLSRVGNGAWASTDRSGEAAIGMARTGGRGMINAGSLEQSNVDLAQQFVDLISHQRAFQANSKTITTADDMLQEIVNLKR